MRLLPLSKVKPGMRLGKKIYNEEGLTLLGEHVELSERLISRLVSSGIDFIYVDDSRTHDIVVQDLLTEETRRKSLVEIRGTFRKLMTDGVQSKGVGTHRLGQTFGGLLEMIMDDLSENKDAMIMLSNIGIVDHYLFQHSLNVCIYSVMLGMSHGYSRDELMTLGLGSLLHDIGKTQIPLVLLQKNGSLTEAEYENIKKHTDYGFQFLKDEPNIPLLAAHCAFQHHERLDGSGYPRGLKGNEIHEYAKWIGLADSFDAMTTNRVYRKAMLPHQAMERLYGGAGTLYEKTQIELFRDRIAVYPIGMTVKLNTGETGVVSAVNAAVPHRPIIRILQDADGEDLKQPVEVDLSEKLNIMITSMNDFQ